MKGIHFPSPVADEMVRAILEGRKTVTRLVVKDRDIINAWDCEQDGTPIAYIDPHTGDSYPPTALCRYQPGDILYVRETFLKYAWEYVYKASAKQPELWNGMWRPSIHMPRDAARIFLLVTDVRVERLQDSFFKRGNTIFNLLREGVDIGKQCRECIETYGSPCCIDDESECGALDDVRSDFSGLWDGTIKQADLALYGWDANTYVWVIEFERISKEEALKHDRH